MNCDVCGLEFMKDENETKSIGTEIFLLGAHPERKRVESVFGKNKFRICFVCVLKSLGVKKIKHVKAGQPD